MASDKLGLDNRHSSSDRILRGDVPHQKVLVRKGLQADIRFADFGLHVQDCVLLYGYKD